MQSRGGRSSGMMQLDLHVVVCHTHPTCGSHTHLPYMWFSHPPYKWLPHPPCTWLSATPTLHSFVTPTRHVVVTPTHTSTPDPLQTNVRICLRRPWAPQFRCGECDDRARDESRACLSPTGPSEANLISLSHSHATLRVGHCGVKA